jgi:sugar phosphate isomerase/epimerase
VISADLNDAPAGIAKPDQQDNTRELPMATGVIDAKAFLSALVQIGYDGPIRAEPFSAKLREMPAPDACQTTMMAMKKAFGLVE